MSENRIPLKQAFKQIFFSVIVISGLSSLGWFYFTYMRSLRIHDPSFNIVAIVQTGPKKELLQSVYLQELLNLSANKRTNLFRFDIKEGEKKLLTSPLIKEASIKKIRPGAIYVDYKIRQPIAFLADYVDAAIDEDGVLFPFKPFFTPKRLPEIYLGDSLEHADWGQVIDGVEMNLALKLLEIIKTLPMADKAYIKRIDVSRAYSDSYGQRQIIVMMEDRFEKEVDGHSVLCIFPRILRLKTSHVESGFAKYQQIRNYLQKQEMEQIIDSKEAVLTASPTIIDLRMDKIAFIEE